MNHRLSGLLCALGLLFGSGCGPKPVTRVEILEVRVLSGGGGAHGLRPPSFALAITGRGFGRSVSYDLDEATGSLTPAFILGILTSEGTPVHLAYPPEIQVESPHQMTVTIVREVAVPSGVYRIGLIEGGILLAEHSIRL
ncbi:MAG: hypothetical protein IPK13_12785 [Deltaproteobacteria bacterium]|nr:hypothetical protein [Deltaproteobacteria bacterium]